MITDAQFLRLRQFLGDGHPLYLAALKVGMDAKTARKYRHADRLPSESFTPKTWRTREDPFQEVWPELRDRLGLNPGLQAKTLFEDLQRRFPGRFPDGQLRTLQRKIKAWRATEGPPKEVFFDQDHAPGELCASDFTCMNDLHVTIGGQPFDHLVYHFVMTYSNWKTVTVCFSESFESLSQGLQNALWELGGVPLIHRTDRLTAAVNNLGDRDLFQQHYRALLAHYGLRPQAIQARKANQNGDIEQRHNRFKTAVDQALLLRGSRDSTTGRLTNSSWFKSRLNRTAAGPSGSPRNDHDWPIFPRDTSMPGIGGRCGSPRGARSASGPIFTRCPAA